MAIGADRRSVVSMVLRQGLALAVPGIVLGLLGTVAVSRVLSAAVDGVSPTDAAALVGLPLVLLLVSALATLAPALRAARLDPRDALRQE
jgi:ABC-type antimicrobial peptide transport system permease subunit